MESLQSKDGQLFVRGLAQYIRQHEKALANSLRLSVQRRQATPNSDTAGTAATNAGSKSSSASTLAAALSFAGLSFRSHSVRSKTLDLTAHHLFYLLSRFEELEVNTGPMNVRIESIHHHPSPSNYVSFLQTGKPPGSRGDADSIHSVSSVRSAMSSMSAFWSSVGMGSVTSKSEKAKLAQEADLKYVYRSCTVLPSLKLTPNHRLPLVKGYEEFPFDTAVPLFVFKNLQQLEIIDVDFRQYHGWDRLAEQLCLLTVKRGSVEDPTDLLINIVLDDAERRRRRSTRGGQDAPSTPSWSVPSTPKAGYAQSNSDPGSPVGGTPGSSPVAKTHPHEEESTLTKNNNTAQFMPGSVSPKRHTVSRPASSYRHVRSYSSKVKRSGSGSSNSSDYSAFPHRSESSSNITNMNILPPSKWQRLVYLSLADNALTHLSTKSLAPLATSLKYFNLSSNLFTEIPDSLSSLTRLVSLDLSNCMIDSLQSLIRYPLPAITTIKLKANRLQSLVGVERLLSLENLDISENRISDPMEAARLTIVPHLRRLNVKRNPFTKTFPDYRVRIMNVFRKTPGYLEDIIIDDQPASSSEKKQLTERVLESEAPPVVQTGRNGDSPVILQQSSLAKTSEQETALRRSNTFPHEPFNNSTRRKNGPKRRIVDLLGDEDSKMSSKLQIPPLISENGLEHRPSMEAAMSESSQAVENPIEIVSVGTETIETISPNHFAEIQADEYRNNIETLRQKFGNNWLNALEDQNWHSDHPVAATSAMRPTIQHVANPVIVSGGRSLG